MILSQYKDGADISIMNCYYDYGKFDQDTGKREDDSLILVYKDNQTGKKYHDIINKPDYTFFKLKDSIILDHNLLFVEKEDVEPVTCKFRNLEKTIAEVTGNMDFYKKNIQNKDRSSNRKLHTCTNVFRSDMAIEDYYRLQFSKRFTNNISKLNKSFFDIEVDTRWMAGTFVEMGECAINAIAFHDEAHDIIHSFLLRDSRNPQIQQLEDDISSGRFTEYNIKEFIRKSMGDKLYKRFQLVNTKVRVHFFMSEIELLKTFFSMVHKYQPDFCEGWNSSGFDLNYIIARCYALGVNPEDIMCDDSWAKKIVKHFIDQKNLSNFAERGDYTFISGNTTWIDQMIQYASRRKSKIGSFKSFKLDDIGYSTARVNKLDYSHITKDIGMLPWLDFKTFFLYNIFDVIVQKCIELKTQDLEYIYAKCIVNNTSYKKGHRQTVYLANRMAKEFDKMGYIIGNNVNKWNEEPDKFLGALVGDPTKTNGYAKMEINGIPIYVCETLQDYDYKSLYPSILLEFNIAPNTQHGRVVIDEKVYINENAFDNPKYSRGGEFIENLVTDNHIEFCKRWLHLGGIKEVLSDMKEYYARFYICYSRNGSYEPYYVMDNNLYTVPIRDSGKDGCIKPISFSDKPIKPLYFMVDRDKTKSWR